MFEAEVNPSKIDKAELVVGVLSYNEADTISHAARQADEGLALYFPDVRGVVIDSDNNSADHTKEAFLKTATRVPKIYISTAPGLQGKGNRDTRTGRFGDLYITVKVGDHPVFKRVGNDIHMTKEIGLTDALLGTTAEVSTIDGPKVVKIPAGAKKVRLRGLGVSDMKGNKGDQYIETEVELPKKLTDRQKVLIEELRKEGL
mgnify:CR=1 FL=1